MRMRNINKCFDLRGRAVVTATRSERKTASEMLCVTIMMVFLVFEKYRKLFAKEHTRLLIQCGERLIHENYLFRG